MTTEKDQILKFIALMNDTIKPFTITAESQHDMHFAVHGPENAYVDSKCGVNVTSLFFALVKLMASRVWKNKKMELQCNNTGSIFWFYED